VSVALLLGCGCFFNVGGGKYHDHNPPTLGRELLELKKARDEGSLSDQNYELMRKCVIEEALAGKR
jgi:hypothetical protein